MEKKSPISKNKTLSRAEEYVRERTKPIFDKVLKETNKNHVSVGSVGFEGDSSYAFYNPHNARYYFKFDRKNLSQKPRGGGRSGIYKDLRVINSSELCADDFQGCRIVVKKNLVEVTNKINKERLIVIEGSEDNRSKLVKESIAVMMTECIDVLHNFIKVYGGNSNFICVNHHVLDNKITHDKMVDSIPLKTTFRNDVVKNVYKSHPSNIEFSDPVYASNYFRNMGLHDYSPAIASELSSVREEFNSFKREMMDTFSSFAKKTLDPLTVQIDLHLEVMREMKDTLKDIRGDIKENSKQTRQDKARKLLQEFGW